MAESWTDDDLLLVTGATGLVGSHVAERALEKGISTRILVRQDSRFDWLKEAGCDVAFGSMTEPYALKAALTGVTHVVHCAAKVGDWGPIEQYRDVNVNGLEYLLEAARESEKLKRFVHISSLGVYPPRDHHGTDETEPTSTEGIDGYTLSKVEAEQLVLDYVRREKLPAIVLRPGFIYGPRDRTVLPRIFQRLRDGQFKFLGSGDQLLNNTYVGNLVDAIFLALERDDLVGEVFNITDGELVSKKTFIHGIAERAGYEKPTASVPLAVAKPLAGLLEGLWKLLGKDSSPILSKATVKFLGLNLDYSSEKAKRVLGYDPQVDVSTGLDRTIDWFREQKTIEPAKQ